MPDLSNLAKESVKRGNGDERSFFWPYENLPLDCLIICEYLEADSVQLMKLR